VSAAPGVATIGGAERPGVLPGVMPGVTPNAPPTVRPNAPNDAPNMRRGPPSVIGSP
jgi:hypothetical protein